MLKFFVIGCGDCQQTLDSWVYPTETNLELYSAKGCQYSGLRNIFRECVQVYNNNNQTTTTNKQENLAVPIIRFYSDPSLYPIKEYQPANISQKLFEKSFMLL